MKARPWMTIPAIFVVCAGLALAMPAMSAVGATSPPTTAVQIGTKKDMLLGGGLAAAIPIRYICPANQFFTPSPGSAEITATSGTMLLQQSTSFPVSCTGKWHYVTLVFAVQGAKFKAGPAIVSASFTICGFVPCVTSSDAKTVILK